MRGTGKRGPVLPLSACRIKARSHAPVQHYSQEFMDLATALVLLIILGPIVWAVVAARRSSAPDVEDRAGGTAVIDATHRQDTRPQ